MTRRTWGAALLAAVMLLTGCASVPSGGEPVDFTQVAEPGAPKQTEPAKGLGVLDVVRGFVNANARIDQDPKLSAAGSYLAPAAQASWQASPTQVMILTAAPRLERVEGREDQVQLSGSTDGYLRPDGSFVTTQRSTYQATITLAQVNGEWRISAPPDVLVLTTSDFNLAYTQRQVYFLGAGDNLVVPDRRWMPNRSQFPATMATDLVDRLIQGPSASLAPAVTNALVGASRRAPIVANAADGVLVIDLTNVGELAGTRVSEIAAQLVYTLRSDAANIRILVDGVPLDAAKSVWTTSLLSSFDPDVLRDQSSAAGQAFYLTATGAMRTLAGAPVWGTAGTEALHGVSGAMSATSRDVAIVGAADDGTPTMFIGSPPREQPMEARLTGPGFSPPSFSRDGDEVWTVTSGDQPEILRLLTAGGRFPVDASVLADIGPPTDVAISPDGARVAFVAKSRVYLAAVVYTASDSSTPAGSSVETATLAMPALLRNDLTVNRVTWTDSQNLLVTGSDASSTYRSVWRIGLDGRQRQALSTRGIVADVDAVAASASLPTLISSGGRIYQLNGDDTTGEWVSVGPADAPLLGSWPIYPS